MLTEYTNKSFTPKIASAIASNYVKTIFNINIDKNTPIEVRNSLKEIKKEFIVIENEIKENSKWMDKPVLFIMTIALAVSLFRYPESYTGKNVLFIIPYIFFMGVCTLYLGRYIYVKMGMLCVHSLNRKCVCDFVASFLVEHPASFFIHKDSNAYFAVFLPYSVINYMLEKLNSKEMNEKSVDLLNLSRNLETLSNYVEYMYIFNSTNMDNYLQELKE